MMKFILAAILCLIPLMAKADSISIMDSLKSLPLKEGVMYDFKNDRFLNTLSFGIINYNNIGLDVSYIGIDAIGATIEYDMSSLPVQNVPILKYVSYLNVGYSFGYRTMTLSPVSDNPKSDNQFIQGPVVFVKLKF